LVFVAPTVFFITKLILVYPQKSIEGSFLRVVIENKGEEIPIDIDLKKHLENKEIQ